MSKLIFMYFSFLISKFSFILFSNQRPAFYAGRILRGESHLLLIYLSGRRTRIKRIRPAWPPQKICWTRKAAHTFR